MKFKSVSIMAILGVLATIATLITGAGVAKAAPAPTISNASAFYFTVPAGMASCTMGFLGYDDQNRKVGITAGHCGQVGTQISTDGSNVVGTTVLSVEPYTGGTTNMDYGLVLFNDDVEFVPSAVKTVRATAPNAPFEWACKTGHGILTAGTLCGPVLINLPHESCSIIPMSWGDSGGPVVRAGTQDALGVVSRLVGICGPFVFTRADFIINTLNDQPAGTPGKGFQFYKG